MNRNEDAQSNFVTVAARSGYAARGVVYLLIGGLATLAAFGSGGQTSDSRGALQSLLGAPLGSTLLVIISLGLAGYALWRLIQAILDIDRHGTDAKGLTVRGALVISALTHISLGVFAFTLVFTLGGSSGSSSGGGSQGFTAWLLSQPYGAWLVGGVGLAVIGAGIAHGIKGWNAEFEKYMTIPPNLQPWAQRVCRFGLVIRGVVLVIVGSFFLLAAYQADASEAGGLSDVFATVRSQPFGVFLLGLVAIGLFAFGVYSLLEAMFRRVDAPTTADLRRQAPW